MQIVKLQYMFFNVYNKVDPNLYQNETSNLLSQERKLNSGLDNCFV